MKAFNFDTAPRLTAIDSRLFDHAAISFGIDNGKIFKSDLGGRGSSWYLETEWFPIFKNGEYIGYIKYLPKNNVYTLYIDKYGETKDICIKNLEYISIEELLDNSDIYIYGTETYDYIKEICR